MVILRTENSLSMSAVAMPLRLVALIRYEDVVQVGERARDTTEFQQDYGEILRTEITMLTVQSVLQQGMPVTLRQLHAHLSARKLSRAWVHVDVDVLDEREMPAVDSPGTPGLTFTLLAQLLRGLIGTGRIAGIDVAIYDPDLDPTRIHARGIVDCLAQVLAGEHA
jgi:arginase